jgi:hypothetical protein
MSNNLINFKKLKFEKIPQYQFINVDYAGRSGSYFFAGLLDGHSQIINFNCVLDQFLFYDIQKIVNNKNKSLSTILPLLSKTLKKYNSLVKSMDNFKKYKFNFNSKKIINNFKYLYKYFNCNNIEFKDMFTLFYLSYACSQERYIDFKNSVILISLHGVTLFKDILFLNAKLKNLKTILLIRNPIKSIDSHLFHHKYESPSNKVEHLFSIILMRYLQSIKFLISKSILNLKFLPFNNTIKKIHDIELSKKYFLISYERLHIRPKYTMKKVCNFLKIEPHSCLFKETMNGYEYKFFSNGSYVDGFSKERALDKRLKYLNFYEKALIEFLFKDIIISFGYKIDSSFLLRVISGIFFFPLFKFGYSSKSGNFFDIINKYFLFFCNILNNEIKNSYKIFIFYTRGKIKNNYRFIN